MRCWLKKKKNHLLLNTKLKVNEKIIYYIDAILITCNIILVYKPFCSKTNSNFSVSHVMAYRFINLFAIRLIITLLFSIYICWGCSKLDLDQQARRRKPSHSDRQMVLSVLSGERDGGQWRIWLFNVDHNDCWHMII